MNIYTHELKTNLKFMSSWLLAIIGIAVVYISFYPSIGKDLENFIQLMDNYPASMRLMLGINLDTFGTILGYFSSFPLTFILICSSISALILGLSILSKEDREKTADFLLTRPVSREKIVSAKLLAALTLIILSNIVFFDASYLLVLLVSGSSVDFKVFALLIGSILFVQLLFLSLGLFISVILPKVKSVVMISMGIAFGFYFLGMFADDKLRVLTPFKYFDATYLLEQRAYEPWYLALSFILVSSMILLTYILYRKKDIHAV